VKDIRAKDDEGEAKQNAGDEGNDFHESSLWFSVCCIL
jgi:hypothetical protein